MRLAPIGRQQRRRSIEQRAGAFAILLLLALFLAGCSSGTARDSAVDRARDAGLPEKLAAQQATHTVEKYFPPTGTPSPTESVPPALGHLAITFGFRPDGTPDGSYASVPAGAGTAYVAAQLNGLSAGQEVRAIMTDAWGNEVSAPAVTIDPGAADRWLALPVGLPAELAPGQYGVYVFADDHVLGSLAFGVTSPGSSAQLLPEAPANPQVRSTVPAPGSTASESAPTETPAAEWQ